MPQPRPRFRPSVEGLESREVPSSTALSESFDTVRTPALPAGWQTWANSSLLPFNTTNLAASNGPASLGSAGSISTASRFWNSTPVAADTAASANIRVGSPAPMAVLARGQNLGATNASYVAAVVSPVGRVELVAVTNGTSRTISSVNFTQPPSGTWLRATINPVGSTATVVLQRQDSGQYLTSAGTWQASATNALTGTITATQATGSVGIGRLTGGQGLGFFDNFTALAPSTGTTQSFDTTAVGSLPTGWTSWKNDGTAGFAVSSSRPLSPARGLSTTGSSPSQSRAWFATALPADTQVSAAVFADSVIPVVLFTRGANLASATPTYYGLTLTRGVEAKLVEVVNGVQTTLTTVKSRTYVSSQWVKITLTTQGDSLRAVVFRTDTNQWLSADGEWVNLPEPALEVTDTTIRTGGFAGVGRPSGYAGTVSFDDFEVRSAGDIAGPVLNVTRSQNGNTVTGDVTFTTTASGPVARRFEFRLNGILKSATAESPATWTLDTTLLANGVHTLAVRALDTVGNVGTATMTFTVNNPNPTPPPVRPKIPQHFDHIRIAALAYDGNPLGSFEQQKLKTAVDVVIPNPKYLSAINTASPGTPQLVYTNLSNLYGGLLTDWLNYADRTGASRELGFYHVSQATAWNGSSPSSQPVTWLWGVYKTPATGTPTDLTGAARGGRTFGTAFGAAGESIAMGYVEKFRELNITLNRTASSSWQSTIEYPAAVDANGNVTQWKKLTVLADSTNGFTAGGRITFDPPKDWVAGKVPGTADRLFYVRVRTTVGTAVQAPDAKTIFGRDYSGANGTDRGMIPAFDYAADTDKDGYLSDAEYANRAAGKDARFVYESRLFYPVYGQMRFATNPSSSAVRRWAGDYHTRLAATMPLSDGFFIDNSNGRLPITGISVTEATNSYADDYAALVSSVWRAIAPRMVFTNTVGGGADANPIAGLSTGAVEEFLLRPMEATWSQVASVAGLVADRLASDSPSPYVVLDTYTSVTPYNDPRTQSAALAYYYLLADPDRTMIMFFGGNSPAAAWSSTWIKAAETNIGKPKDAMMTFATGVDPHNEKFTYKVFSRQYDNALVLYKPLSYTLGVGTGTRDDRTATSHELGGKFRVLNAAGTLGPIVTKVALRNGEGMVLIKA